MPELPEVETIKRGLEQVLPGKEIKRVDVDFTKSMPAVVDDITNYVTGAKVSSIRRRGKVMIIDLSSGYSLLIHLKMTGQLVFDYDQKQTLNSKPETLNKSEFSKSKNSKGLEFSNSDLGFTEAKRFGGGHPTKSMVAELPDKSTRVVFTFDDGSKLYFNDQRKFGWIKLVESENVEKEKFFENMGPEPLGSEFGISNLESRIKKSKRAIKAILLDQSTVAGLGNIYADEALHLAKIHPLRAGQYLSLEEVERLHAAIIKVLQNSIDDGGTSFTSYVKANGGVGDYLQNARVYRREGEACPECGAAIEKIKVAQRGTHVCPQCQSLGKS